MLKMSCFVILKLIKIFIGLTPGADPINLFFFSFQFLLFNFSVLLHIKKSLILKWPSLAAKTEKFFVIEEIKFYRIGYKLKWFIFMQNVQNQILKVKSVIIGIKVVCIFKSKMSSPTFPFQEIGIFGGKKNSLVLSAFIKMHYWEQIFPVLITFLVMRHKYKTKAQKKFAGIVKFNKYVDK